MKYSHVIVLLTLLPLTTQNDAAGAVASRTLCTTVHASDPDDYLEKVKSAINTVVASLFTPENSDLYNKECYPDESVGSVAAAATCYTTDEGKRCQDCVDNARKQLLGECGRFTNPEDYHSHAVDVMEGLVMMVPGISTRMYKASTAASSGGFIAGVGTCYTNNRPTCRACLQKLKDKLSRCDRSTGGAVFHNY
ncbi:hypothetical protein LINPERHAP1_LOCUS27968, partial [Linum perenne]